MSHPRPAYHPFRKHVVAGNPNSASDRKKLAFLPENLPPLEEYLKNHGISYAEYVNFVKGLGSTSQVVTPFSGSYDEARKESDNAFDKYPLMVVYCGGVADVVASVQFAKKQNIKVCARAGGHNTAGYSVLNNHLVIDVSRMKGISIDTFSKVATVGAGVTWGDFNHELNAYGLHTPGGSCDTVGVTGYTLGGGYGYTSMRWGVACDNLMEVTMVTANGEIVTANSSMNPELHWAHQGGTGGNFGIVVSLKYRLYELKNVWLIEINWDINSAAAVLTEWQNHMTKTLSDRHLGLLGFLATKQRTETRPDGEKVIFNDPYFCLRGIYSGEDRNAGQKALEPLLRIGKPTFPIPLWTKYVNYSFANEHLLDNVEGVIPDTIKETKRCAYVERPLTQADYQQMVDYFKRSPNLYNIVSMEPYGGAINERKPSDTAFVHREAFFDIFVDSFWQDDSDKNIAFKWLYDYFESEPMKHLWSNHYYQNYPNSEYKNWQEGYFGINYPMLQKVKAKWDPTNFFTFPQAIELPK